jgi:16S rRNA (cytosine1402-N4)-methyltransferase
VGTLHEPVLLAESLEALAVRPGGFWVDGTVGAGGHAAEILRRSAPGGRLLGTDRDLEALAAAAAVLAPFGERARLVHADYRELPGLVDAPPDGILLDLGVSSLQFDRAERGFSLKNDGPLDMRMDQSGGVTAADVVNRLPEAALADIIYRYGEERASRRIARRIVETRRRAPIRSTLELATLVRAVVRAPRGRGIDPATRTFQALRIAVNRELDILPEAIDAALEALVPGGRCVALAYHSGEDRIVKDRFRHAATGGCTCPPGLPCVCAAVATVRLIRSGAAKPTPIEVAANRRAASARLRAVEKLASGQ